MNLNIPHPIEDIINTIEELKSINKYTEARATALQALSKYTDDYRIYEELADIYIFEENLDKAEEVIGYARALHPDSGTGAYLEGYIAAARGDFDRAIEILSVANNKFPNNAEIIRNLGWSYVMRGDIARGLGLLRRAYVLAPEDLMIINDLGVALMASGAEDEARALFEKSGHTVGLGAIQAMDN
ncbi:tetratricopeptide repeat protein [Candidatus Gracilibacteria bacterium]|nr:tetratricopeptide repeat protein [Candidatus Gracilibacteria bacterium]